MPPTVLVTGDVVLEHRLYGVNRTPRTDDEEPGTTLSRQLGGAALLCTLLHDAADVDGLRHDARLQAWNEENAKRTRQGKAGLPNDDLPANRPAMKFDVALGIDAAQLEQSLPPHLHTYSTWTPQAKSKGQKSSERVWRMTGRFNPGTYAAAADSAFRPQPATQKNAPELTVIDDHALRFRHDRSKPLWPDTAKARHIILRMAGPLLKGELWPHLEAVRDRLIVVVSAADLRREDIQINTRLSWERAVEDTVRALAKDYVAMELTRAAHVAVNFGSAGALWMRRDGQQRTARLVFDPARLAGEHSSGFTGTVSGLQACLPLGLAYWLTLTLADPKADAKAFATAMGRGIASGLAARRGLIEIGHGEASLSALPQFPTREVAELVARDPGGFTSIDVPLGAEGEIHPDWTVLVQTEIGLADRAPLYGLGEMAARYGVSALSHVPSFRRGRLFTADRIEIESLRTLESLIREYENTSVQKKPLSIGVFGPPGAGKSFAVKALAEGVLGPKVPFLEFNLSQFKGPEDLIGAFHRVRDAVLGGITPVAFWDEFDSRHYEWLQYLLAPMQDGAFQEREVTHPIGKSIFVFAGGTSPTIERFGVREPAPLDDAALKKLKAGEREARERVFVEQTKSFQEFKLLKGPDFISRLHGFLHVLGPNGSDEGSQPDVSWPVRRGLLVRALLGLPDDRELQMDSGLLNALLRIPRYRHGARSFEKIVRALEEGKEGGRLIRAALPSDSLLARETDAAAFHVLLRQRDVFKKRKDIEALAKAIHDRYRETAGGAVEPALNRSYEELEEDKKAANRAAARRIVDHLALINFALERREDGDRSWKKPLSQAINQHVERLARAEHLGWWAERRANGWTYHPNRNDLRKQHPSLTAWAKLSPADQAKDRNAVLAIPDYLEVTRHKAVPTEGA